MGKSKIPENLRRVPVVGRVYPRTAEFLESLGEPNYGRAIDRLVDMHRAIMKAMKPEARMQFEPLVPLPKMFTAEQAQDR